MDAGELLLELGDDLLGQHLCLLVTVGVPIGDGHLFPIVGKGGVCGGLPGRSAFFAGL